PARWRRPGTTRWSWTRRRSPTSSRSPPGPATGWSWACGTASAPWRACSSTPSRASPPTVTTCSGPSWAGRPALRLPAPAEETVQDHAEEPAFLAELGVEQQDRGHPVDRGPDGKRELERVRAHAAALVED